MKDIIFYASYDKKFADFYNKSLFIKYKINSAIKNVYLNKLNNYKFNIDEEPELDIIYKNNYKKWVFII